MKVRRALVVALVAAAALVGAVRAQEDVQAMQPGSDDGDAEAVVERNDNTMDMQKQNAVDPENTPEARNQLDAEIRAATIRAQKYYERQEAMAAAEDEREDQEEARSDKAEVRERRRLSDRLREAQQKHDRQQAENQRRVEAKGAKEDRQKREADEKKAAADARAEADRNSKVDQQIADWRAFEARQKQAGELEEKRVAEQRTKAAEAESKREKALEERQKEQAQKRVVEETAKAKVEATNKAAAEVRTKAAETAQKTAAEQAEKQREAAQKTLEKQREQAQKAQEQSQKAQEQAQKKQEQANKKVEQQYKEEQLKQEQSRKQEEEARRAAQEAEGKRRAEAGAKADAQRQKQEQDEKVRESEARAKDAERLRKREEEDFKRRNRAWQWRTVAQRVCFSAEEGSASPAKRDQARFYIEEAVPVTVTGWRLRHISGGLYCFGRGPENAPWNNQRQINPRAHWGCGTAGDMMGTFIVDGGLSWVAPTRATRGFSDRYIGNIVNGQSPWYQIGQMSSSRTLTFSGPSTRVPHRTEFYVMFGEVVTEYSVRQDNKGTVCASVEAYYGTQGEQFPPL